MQKRTKQAEEIGVTGHASAFVGSGPFLGDIPVRESHTITTPGCDISGLKTETSAENDDIERKNVPRFHLDTFFDDTCDRVPVERYILLIEALEVIGIHDDTLASGGLG